MDPLSIGASVIAVVGATGKVIKGIRRLKALQDAPRELDDLSAEICEFEVVLRAIQKINDNPVSELGRLLETAQRILTEFESLIEYKLTEAGTSSKVDRWQWTHNSKDVERLRGQLRDVKANLIVLLCVSTDTTVDQVSQVTNQVLSEQRQIWGQVIPDLALVKQLLVRQLLEEPPSTRAALTGSLGDLRQLTLESTSPPESTSADIPESKTLQVGQTASKLRPHNRLRVGKVQTVSMCTPNCACRCHFLRRLNDSGILSKIFGHGYVQTVGYPLLGARCNTDLCKAHAAPRISVQYVLPQWLISRMIFIWFTSSPSCSPELLLRVPRFVDRKTNKAFLALRQVNEGDKDLKIAIRDGDCTPYDVDERGETLLTIAARSTMWSILYCLSHHGEFCDPSSFAPWAESEIWRNLVLAPLNVSRYSFQRPLTVLFPLIEWEVYVQRQVFTTLHQIVCGLSGISLQAELQGSTVINSLDRDGRSAVWYAARHRKRNYVRILLEQGADPNIGDPPIGALFWAHGSHPKDYLVTKRLLNYSASLSHNINPSTTPCGWLPWLYIRLDYEASRIDELLVRYGIDLNTRAKWYGVEDVTILMLMAQNNAPYRLKRMIKSGADINVIDGEGKTAIMYATCSSSTKAFEPLARAGARIDLRTSTGSTILHLAIAQTTSTAPIDQDSSVFKVPSLCEAMRDTDLTSIDLDAEDEDGHRAYDLLRKRNGPNWDRYCQAKGIETRWWLRYDEADWEEMEKQGEFSHTKDLENEINAICALEKLLHHIQELQGVPESDRYPPLGEYLSRDAEDKAVPGAWPAY